MTPYLANLMELRKKFDLWPWIDTSAVLTLNGAPAGLVATGKQKRSYDVLFDKMCFSWQGYGQRGTGDSILTYLDGNRENRGVPTEGATFLWWLGLGGNFQQEYQQTKEVHVRQICGNVDDEWVPLVGGRHIPAKETMQWLARYIGPTTTAPTVDAAVAYLGLRGYRTHEKGTTDPPQLTRREWLQRGAQFQQFTYNKVLQVDLSAGPTGAPTTEPIAFDKPFLIHSIRVALQGTFGVDPMSGPFVYSRSVLNAVAALRVSIERTSTSPIQRRQFGSDLGLPVGSPIMDGTPVLFFENQPYTQQLTPLLANYSSAPPNTWAIAWKFPIPVTVPEFDVYTLKLFSTLGISGTPIPDPPIVPIEVVFEGELIFEDPSKPRLVTGRGGR